jgi:hypothetical protein
MDPPPRKKAKYSHNEDRPSSARIRTFLFDCKEIFVHKENIDDIPRNFRTMLGSKNVTDYRIPVTDEKIQNELGIYEITNIPPIMYNRWSSSELNESRRNGGSLQQEIIFQRFPIIKGKNFGIQFIKDESDNGGRYLSTFKRKDTGFISNIFGAFCNLFINEPAQPSPCNLFSLLIERENNRGINFVKAFNFIDELSSDLPSDCTRHIKQFIIASNWRKIEDIKNLENFRDDISINSKENSVMEHVVRVGLCGEQKEKTCVDSSGSYKTVNVGDDNGNYHLVFISFLYPADVYMFKGEFLNKVLIISISQKEIDEFIESDFRY